MKKLLFLILGLHLVLYDYALQAQTYQSKYGYQLPPRGTVKILYVFAEVGTAQGCLRGPDNWPAGQLPSDANAYIEHAVTSNPQSYLGKYYKDVTLGEFNLIGDYYNGIIQVPCSSGDQSQDVASAISVLNSTWQADAQGKYRTANGLELNAFDDYTYSTGTSKPAGTPDGKIDAIVVLWRNHPVFSCGGGYGVGNVMSMPLKNKTAYLFGSWGHCPNSNYGMFIAEFFHSWMGGNNFHTSSGAADWTFWTITGNYAASAQSGGTSNVVCGWDRDFLGIKGTRPYTIGALDPGTSTVVNTDISIASKPNGMTVVLRDFVTVGDAIRIKLPHINWAADGDTKNQYLWIENHQKVSPIDRNFPDANGACSNWSKGIYAYIQAGKDVKGSNTSDDVYGYTTSQPNGLGSYLFPLSGEGNYDFYYEYATKNATNVTCQWGNKSLPYSKQYPDGSIKPNPFTGFSDLFGAVDIEAPNDKIGPEDGWQAKFQKYTGIPNGVPPAPTIPAFGDQYDAFVGTGKIMSIATNPAPVPVYTLKSNNYSTINSYENRTIWLNGLSVEVLSTDYYANGTGAYQVRIKWDDYSVNKDARWCGYIRLDADAQDPLARVSKIKIEPRKKITLDKGLSPTQDWKANFIDGSNSFTEPTVLTISSGTKLTVSDSALLEIVNGSSLIVKSGATLEVLGTGKITVDQLSHICIEPGAILNITNHDIGGIITYNTNPALNNKGDVFPVLVSGVPSHFLKETHVYEDLQCNGPGLISTASVYSKGFKARESIELLPGFSISSANAATPVFTAVLQQPLQNCSNLFVPEYVVGGTTNVINAVLGGKVHSHEPYKYSWLFETEDVAGHGHDHTQHEGYDVQITDEMQVNHIYISPNPSDGLFHLVADDPNTFVNWVEIKDTQGKTVRKVPVDQTVSSVSIDIQDEVSGLYFLIINTNKGVFNSKVHKK